MLLDLWATWCDPCKEEEPYWEKLIENFADKDVVFVGLQLHAGPGNIISEAYQVAGIPRYILIDKKGKIISAERLRPSSENLPKLLETWSAK